MNLSGRDGHATPPSAPLGPSGGAAPGLKSLAVVVSGVPAPIRFEEADGDERTQIGEGLTRFAVRGERLETGREEGRYFLRHDDGCAVCGAAIRAGDAFYLDPEDGSVLCELHGTERREDAEEG